MNVVMARSFVSRLKGLIGSHPTNETLLFLPCNDLHTFGMKFNIDVLFLDKDWIVLESYRAIAPFKRLKCKKAFSAMERISRDEYWPVKGEMVNIVSINRI